MKIKVIKKFFYNNYYFMILTLHKIGEVHFDLLGTNAFHVKTKNERFTAVGSHCCQNLKYENFVLLFGPQSQKIASRSNAACSTIIFPYLTNEIIDLWCCHCHCC